MKNINLLKRLFTPNNTDKPDPSIEVIPKKVALALAKEIPIFKILYCPKHEGYIPSHCVLLERTKNAEKALYAGYVEDNGDIHIIAKRSAFMKSVLLYDLQYAPDAIKNKFDKELLAKEVTAIVEPIFKDGTSIEAYNKSIIPHSNHPTSESLIKLVHSYMPEQAAKFDAHVKAIMCDNTPTTNAIEM